MRFISSFDQPESFSSHQEYHQKKPKQSDKKAESPSPSPKTKQKMIQKGHNPKSNPLPKKQEEEPIEEEWLTYFDEEKKQALYLSEKNPKKSQMVNEEEVPVSDSEKENWQKQNRREAIFDLSAEEIDEQSITNQRPDRSQPLRKRQQFEEDEDDIRDLRMLWIQFFISISQQKGLVFPPRIRKVLNKIHNPERHYTPNHQLEPEGLEQQKIAKEIDLIDLFNGKLNIAQMNSPNFHQDLQADMQTMTTLFTKASYIFCSQVTEEYYEILRKICNIVLEFRHNLVEMEIQLRRFGDKIASQKDPNHQYFYFGFQFTKVPDGRTISKGDLRTIREAQLELKPQFRTPGVQFADFIEKVGFHLLEEMRKLRLWRFI